MSSTPQIDFAKQDGLVPVIVQDAGDKLVYMLGYMNEEALDRTAQSGYAHFWSRSRRRIWMKGEESGNKLRVIDILKDCDDDTLLLRVELQGSAACHTGHNTCFYRKLNEETS